MPKMSTEFIGRLINQIVHFMPPDQCYLNIGVWYGFTFLSGMLDNRDKCCIGVDNFSQFSDPKDAFYELFSRVKSNNHFFFELGYKEYLKRVHTQEIGFYLYDAIHTYEDQLENLKLAEPFFSEDCVIMVDDSNWDYVRQATLDFISSSKNDYQMLLDEKSGSTSDPRWWNGIMIFKRRR